MSFLSKIFGSAQTSSVRKFEPIVAKINAFEASLQSLSDNELKAKTTEFRKKLGVVGTRMDGTNVVTSTVERATSVDFGDAKQSQTKTLRRREEGEVTDICTLDDILPEAFAVVREVARRTLGQRHFDVQLLGGMVLNSGAIAEMRTGEGKTLVATLSVYLNALSGKGVHVVTVNDYLSRRDAVWMGQIYNALGLTVGVINHEASFLYDPLVVEKDDISSHSKVTSTVPASTKATVSESVSTVERATSVDFREAKRSETKTLRRREEEETDGILDKQRDALGSFKVVHEYLRPCTRRQAYEADITYGTNSEFGFDYLRDNLEYSPDRLRQREFNYAVVDEIDSILIDEARTPLIISAPTRDAEGTYKQFASLTAGFVENEDYTVDLKKHAITLLGSGIEKAEKALGVENIYTDKGIKFVHHLETAVKAKALYHLNKEYVVRDNQIVIVDEFTGRLQPGRRWSEGLHQAIEAKEGVSVQQESRTYASITYQNFFRIYPKLSGMTGTAATSSEEFFKVYGLSVFEVPTNKAVIRKDQNDQIFRTEVGKYRAIARKVKELHDKGQPVLIGTVSIEKNELLSQFLKSEGLTHSILNAKPEYAEKEGETIAQAGKKGAVTIATNMAGRGVDIKLGGNPNTPELYEDVKAEGGLFVLGTERHEARRIDNQLRGRSGRQGDPGETQFFVSLEDQLMRVFASDSMKSMMGKLGVAEDQPIEHRLISRALESAQEKIEGFNFDSRKHVLEFDDIINTQRTSVYSRRRKLLIGNANDVERELLDVVGEDSSDLIKNKIAEYGRENFLNACRIVLLQTIDMYWVEHLEVMDYTRSSVNLRAYGQRDPLVEYKKEGLRLFHEMQDAVREQVVRILPNIVPIANGQPVASNTANSAEMKEIHENARIIGAGDGSNTDASKTGNHSSKKEPELGRNDPCWCGSGKKYKKCHGK